MPITGKRNADPPKAPKVNLHHRTPNLPKVKGATKRGSRRVSEEPAVYQSQYDQSHDPEPVEKEKFKPQADASKYKPSNIKFAKPKSAFQTYTELNRRTMRRLPEASGLGAAEFNAWMLEQWKAVPSSESVLRTECSGLCHQLCSMP